LPQKIQLQTNANRQKQKSDVKALFRSGLHLNILAFISCSSTSSISSNNHIDSFESIEKIEPVWQKLAEGVEYFQGKVIYPKLDFHAIRIDLLQPNLQIVVSAGTLDNDGKTLSSRVTSFVRNFDLITGINAVPFDRSSSAEGLPIQNMGIVISNGLILSTANPGYDALVFYSDGTASIINQSQISGVENIINAVGGFFQILTDGQPSERTFNSESRHPRSAAGLSMLEETGSYLYLLVIDGRRSGSIGATENETALILKQLGSLDGINFDGGGSSTLVIRSSDNKIRAANTPIHGGIHGRERAVAGCLGIRN